MEKNIKQFLWLLSLITVCISIFFIPAYSNSEKKFIEFVEDGNLLWPAPGYYRINSYFGRRYAPTSGASTYHSGIDIGAPQGSEYVAVTNGTITFVGFLGAGGYTITLTDDNKENGEIRYTYCHSDPNFLVKQGEKVLKGQVIGKVGPKNVYGLARKYVQR